MRRAFAHDALLDMNLDADERAPGASVTVALCGHWDHEPPCPLAPHHTEVEREGREVRLRILFASEPEREAEVRQGIQRALATGELAGPDGATSRWLVRQSTAGQVTSEEEALARRLAVDEP